MIYPSTEAEAAAVRRAATRAGCRIKNLAVGATVDGLHALGVVTCPDGWAAARLLLASAIEDSKTEGVLRVARELRRRNPSAEAFARAVHAYVRAKVVFRREQGEIFQNAGFTLDAAYGDCDDHARAVIALSLAGGVPATLALLHWGDGAPPSKQGPTHAVARVCPDGRCSWAETTVDAAYGEAPIDAARRTGVIGQRQDIASEVRIMTPRDLDETEWPEPLEPRGAMSGAPLPVEHRATNAYGLDVSSAQGPNVDYAKVRGGGRTFVIVKLTDKLGVDSQAASNMAKAKAAGLLRSGYHFTYFTNPPEVEAKHFAATIRAMGGVDFPPTLDFEAVEGRKGEPRYMRTPIPEADAAAWAVKFMRAMRDEGFPVTWLYSYPSYLKQLGKALIDSGLPNECELWIADYSRGAYPGVGVRPVIFDPTSAWYLPGTWDSWICWQTHGNDEPGAPIGSARAPRVPGVPMAVDHDIFNGTPEELGFKGDVPPLSRPKPGPADVPIAGPGAGSGGGGVLAAAVVGTVLAVATAYTVWRS